jgi:hypothetical protein
VATTKSSRTARPAATGANHAASGPRLLAGGNPQIPKGEGDAPVQAWIAAVPGWKRKAAQQLDALIVAAVPGVHKAVKWNSPLYAAGDEGWFLSMHCHSRYIKVAFFRGASLTPVPPEPSKSKDTRYLHVFEDAPLDQVQFTRWVKQASGLPGERM